ncbi:MAG: NAD-dependent epimerase/dehydratase family protein [Kiloniellales bacterium]
MALLVTGVAGFIGYHLAEALLADGRTVLGIDSLNDYYDPKLKNARLTRLEARPGFEFRQINVADRQAMFALADQSPDIETIVHLAAQAGVRYSLDNPAAYVDANVMGQLAVLELARRLPNLSHLVYASSSSVYGRNEKQPFAVGDPVERPASVYAATKRAGELLARTYADLYGLPVTGLRFFTVYGPWGRPDMAYYRFTRAIFEDRPIRVFNQGRMKRDFTYIDDILTGLLAAIERPPAGPGPEGGGDEAAARGDLTTHRLYNLGNHRTEPLLRFIEVLEAACGREARKEMTDMQPGDVAETYADIASSTRDLGFQPTTTIDEGLPRFVAWFRDYHGV